MSLIDSLTARLPFAKKTEEVEYYFALNIGLHNLAVCVWTIKDNRLKILNQSLGKYSSREDLISETDKLLDQALGEEEPEPHKILFGVLDSWLLDDNLKDANLKLLRSLVKELELQPLAYVSTTHALAHLLEKKEGVPTTAILIGITVDEVLVTVARAGKLDGSKVVSRGENIGSEVEKALLTFSKVEVLPSKILVYGDLSVDLDKIKSNLLSFPWMSKLSFLHFPKIDILEEGVEIKAIALAGATELNDKVTYESEPIDLHFKEKVSQSFTQEEEMETELTKKVSDEEEGRGFIVGDVMAQKGEEGILDQPENPKEEMVEKEDFVPERNYPVKLPPLPVLSKVINHLRDSGIILGIIAALVLIILGYLFFFKAEVIVYVEPKILEKDAQITADPVVASVNEEQKIIPGFTTNAQVSGSDKMQATGIKQIGDRARGTVVIYNKTDSSKTFSQGTTLTTSDGINFTLDSSVSIASQSAVEDGTVFGKVSAPVTANQIGADGNIPSGTALTVTGLSSSQFSAKAEGNFSGGTSRQVTVVSDSDQKKLLATLAASLRKQAQGQLQEKLSGKKILEDALSEEVVKKTFSKNINDQAGDFSLNMTINYKGIAYSDDDLKRIVSKLVDTSVPDGYKLDLSQTETQADVSKIDKNKLIFLARFKAKLLPKLNSQDLLGKIKGKTPYEAAQILKGIDNILGSEIKLIPSLPSSLQRLPLLDKNIKLEVSLK